MTCIVACGLRIIMVNSRPISEQRHHKYEAIIGQGHEGIWQHMYFAISEGRVRISPLFFYVLERKKSVIHSEAFIVVRARSTNSLIHAHIPGLTRDNGTTCRDLLEVDSAVMGE
jgi:hypothetical protein